MLKKFLMISVILPLLLSAGAKAMELEEERGKVAISPLPKKINVRPTTLSIGNNEELLDKILLQVEEKMMALQAGDCNISGFSENFETCFQSILHLCEDKLFLKTETLEIRTKPEIESRARQVMKRLFYPPERLLSWRRSDSNIPPKPRSNLVRAFLTFSA